MALLAEVLKGCRDLVYLFNLIPKDSLGELEHGDSCPFQSTGDSCRANQVAQETISPEMGLTADPSQGFSEKADTCSLHLAILFSKPHTVLAGPGPGPGHCTATRGQWPSLQHRSVLTHTGVGTRTETFRFYWAYFLVRNEGQFSHF